MALVDLVMPEMSGWEMMQVMKNDPRLFLIPVIILSASTDKDNVGERI